MTDDRTRALVDALRLTRRRSEPLIALGIVAALLAVGAMAWLIVENRRQAGQIERLHKISAQKQDDAQKDLNRLRTTLHQLSQPDTGETSLITRAISQANAASKALGQAQALNIDPTSLADVNVPPTGSTLGVQTIARGAKSGWDSDLFWCAGANQEVNYSSARVAGLLLGIEAANSRSIAPGIGVGRVRLRPVREQDRDAWPAGSYVVSDIKNNDETKAADAVAKFLSSKQIAVTQSLNKGDPSSYYLSIFFCR